MSFDGQFGLLHTPPEQKKRLLSLSTVVTTLTPAPANGFSLTNSMPVPWQAYGNNSVGNCVPAACERLAQVQTNYRNSIRRIPDMCGEIFYAEVTGWNWNGIGPGTNPVAALNAWRQKGMPVDCLNQPTIISTTAVFSGQVNANLLTSFDPTAIINVGQILNAPGVQAGLHVTSICGNNQYTMNGSHASVGPELMNTYVSTTAHPISIARDWIDAYAHLTPGNVPLFWDSLYNFVGNLLTLWAPRAWGNSAIWDAPPASVTNPASDPQWEVGGAGGHMVTGMARVPPGGPVPSGILIGTWAGTRLITDRALDYVAPPNMWFETKYVQDAYVVISKNCLDPVTLQYPDGLDYAALQNWLNTNATPSSPF